MKAILLAAGYGTRLKPLTDNVPKCLVTIKGVPLLEIWLEQLFSAGVDEVLINTHYLSNNVAQFIDQYRFKNKVVLMYEPILLGTAGTLMACKEFIKTDPILLAHADNLTKFNVIDFFKEYYRRPKQCDMTMMTFFSDNPSSCGIVTLNCNGIVVGFEEKPNIPKSNLANAAVYIISPDGLDRISKIVPKVSDFSSEVIPKMLRKINTYHNKKYHRDIGTIESLSKAQIEYKP